MTFRIVKYPASTSYLCINLKKNFFDRSLHFEAGRFYHFFDANRMHIRVKYNSASVLMVLLIYFREYVHWYTSTSLMLHECSTSFVRSVLVIVLVFRKLFDDRFTRQKANSDDSKTQPGIIITQGKTYIVQRAAFRSRSWIEYIRLMLVDVF